MNKEKVYEELVVTLREVLNMTLKASQDAADYATNEESRAESKWDTQGLEASYLAAGQAANARELTADIQKLVDFRGDLTAACNAGRIGALVHCAMAGDKDWYYLAPVGGGQIVQLQGEYITVVSPQSPIYQALLGKRQGQSFQMPNGAQGDILCLM